MAAENGEGKYCYEVIMDKKISAIDKAILDTNNNICKNIDKFNASERGFWSQNILGQLRNLVEYIAIKLCSTDVNVDPNDYEKRCELLKNLKTRGDLKLLYNFHELLQKSASHYTLDENASERLMLKYFEYILKIKLYLAEHHNLLILQNINDFPLDTDNDINEYHQKIAEKIDNKYLDSGINTERLYIQKKKPFFVNGKIYYEITFTLATDNVSKFDRVIAFTSQDILENYAVKLSMHKDSINIIDSKMEILIIDSWETSIRPCELDHFGYIFTGESTIHSNYIAYKNLMRFLSDSSMNLLELLNSSNYKSIKRQITKTAKNTAFFDILDSCRNIIKNDLPASNVLKYLLYTMNNVILKSQIYRNGTCDLLSDLHLKYECIPFEEMPFSTSLVNHNPRIFDLLQCIESENKEDEFLARHIQINTEQNGVLFTKIKDLKRFQNIDKLIDSYNGRLYYKHKETRSLMKYSENVFINEYAEDCAYIITRFKELTKSGLKGYTNSVNMWLQSKQNIDDTSKKDALLQMFSASHVVFIYGSAGTGKSTLVKYISEFFVSKDKLYLANTNPAIDNLKRKVGIANCDYMTITKFLSNKNSHIECDLLFIDECSTVCNSDMRKILEKAEFKLLILVGDTYQIESIRFGNWFAIARCFVQQSAVFELKNTFRSNDKNLKTVWDSVRNLENGMQEAIEKFGYSKRLDKSIFDKCVDDEIILCLNYDGLYGINSINSFLQNNNKNNAVMYGVNTYKIGDPVLFNESNKFSPIIYNNMKGIIRNIKENQTSIVFDIEIDAALNEMDVGEYDFELLETPENHNSIIRFSIDKKINTDTDNNSYSMPFQIAYAISIHKAQGLEYDSVKIVLTDEVEEQITHNIFYTAITRARKNLTIFWSPEVEYSILSKLQKRDNANRDAKILKNKYQL